MYAFFVLHTLLVILFSVIGQVSNRFRQTESRMIGYCYQIEKKRTKFHTTNSNLFLISFEDDNQATR